MHPVTCVSSDDLIEAVTRLCAGRESVPLASVLQVTLTARQSSPGSREYRLVVARPKIMGNI